MSQTSGLLGRLVSQSLKVLLCGQQSELAPVTVSGPSLAAQWFRFFASNAGGMGLVPVCRIKIPHAA